MTETEVADVFERAPFIRLVGYRLVGSGRGWVETELVIEPHHLQQHGYVHAGVITTMADHTSGGAASTVVAEGHSILTAQFGINFLRPARGAALHCRGEVVKPGRALVVTQSDVHCDGVHVARFQGTMAVVEGGLDG
jgi:uncharacterized protein (TIGR00369 family)